LSDNCSYPFTGKSPDRTPKLKVIVVHRNFYIEREALYPALHLLSVFHISVITALNFIFYKLLI